MASSQIVVTISAIDMCRKIFEFKNKCQTLLGKDIWPLKDHLLRVCREYNHTSQQVNELFDRVFIMLSRGDTLDQISHWLESCPLEIEYCKIVERVYPDFYPGGPGAKFIC